MDPGAISIADKIIDRHGLAGLMIVILLGILWMVWRELVQTRRDSAAQAEKIGAIVAGNTAAMATWTEVIRRHDK